MPCLDEARDGSRLHCERRVAFSSAAVSTAKCWWSTTAAPTAHSEIAGAGGRPGGACPRQGYGSALRCRDRGGARPLRDHGRRGRQLRLRRHSTCSSPALRDGADLVMGNRFKGGIAPGAMPPLHRYLGNPVLSRHRPAFLPQPGGRFPLRHAWLSQAGDRGARPQHRRHGIRERNGGAGDGGRNYASPRCRPRFRPMAAIGRRTCAVFATAGGIFVSCSCSARAGCSCIPERC